MTELISISGRCYMRIFRLGFCLTLSLPLTRCESKRWSRCFSVECRYSERAAHCRGRKRKVQRSQIRLIRKGAIMEVFLARLLPPSRLCLNTNRSSSRKLLLMAMPPGDASTENLVWCAKIRGSFQCQLTDINREAERSSSWARSLLDLVLVIRLLSTSYLLWDNGLFNIS